MISLNKIVVSAFLSGTLCAIPTSAAELVLLPIREIQSVKNDEGLQLLVTLEYQACRFAYRGIYLEPENVGQGQARYSVRALATERSSRECDGPQEPRTESILIAPITSDRYEFTAVQPK
ncbi:MAG: hypothetical protein HC902_13605 [Calothrix sp. SM1_5_4]|nr:hypothetical protein [Calothrix sp. SM1_5_4]